MAVGRRPHLTVFGSDWDTKDGTGVRDYIHVVDLARGHVAALNQGVFGKAMKSNCEVYNLGTETEYLFWKWVVMRKASGKEIKYVMGPRRAGTSRPAMRTPKRQTRAQMDSHFGVDKMCEDTWRWQSNNPKGFAGDPAAKGSKEKKPIVFT